MSRTRHRWRLVWLVSVAGLAAVGCHTDRAAPVDRSASDKSGGLPAGLEGKTEGITGSNGKSGRSQTATLPFFLEKAVVPHVSPRFVDCARDVGIDFTYYNDEVPGRYFLPEVMGGGLAWLDYDADGWLDLYATNGAQLRPSEGTAGPHENRLFRSLGPARFADVSSRVAAGADRGFGQGCAVGDFNADGFPDLYVTNYGPNRLLRNNGDGTFDDVTAQAGAADELWGASCLWCDLDADGDLDLYVVNYLDVRFDNLQSCRFQGKPGYCGPGNYLGVPDRAFLNEGDGSFVDRSEAIGCRPDVPGKGLAVAAIDLDHDGRFEIYVGNDMSPNFLFTRSPVAFAGSPKAGDAPRLYQEVAGPAACAVSDVGQNEATMGIACGDFDRDGMSDIFLSHFFQQKNTLYKNLGGLLFKDESRRTRIAATSYDFLGFGTAAFDYDFDGWLDLFIANGHVLGPELTPNAMTAQLLRNDNTGRFDDISAEAGDYFRQLHLGRGMAAADFDQDGDLDLAVSHLHEPATLLRNETRVTGHYLGISLATLDRVPPIGARVVASAGDKSWIVPRIAGGSYLSSPDPRLLLALPTSDPVTLEVHWPSGTIDRWESVTVDQYIRLLPGQEPEAVSRFSP